MKKAGFAIFFLWSFAHIQTGYAQFSYDKIEDVHGFELEKPLEFYWTPRYNRVEGLFLNWGVKVRPEAVPKLLLYGDAGWGFWNDSGKQFRFNAGVQKSFLEFNRLTFGADVFRKLGSEDGWLVGEVENSLAALFFREDYKDYYGLHGFRVYADHKFLGTHLLRLEIGRHTYDALERNINWSVFGGTFPENPQIVPTTPDTSFIAEGDEIGLKLIVAFDKRDNPVFPLTGWYIEGIYERTAEDFDTDGLFLTIKRYQQTFGNHRLLVRGMLGTRGGSVAEQHTIDLGGVGSLRGFDDKEFSGNRIAMLNANYLFGGDVLQKIPLQNVPVFGAFWTTLSLGLFLDTGFASFTDENAGLFDGFSDVFDNFKTDIGFSLLVLEGVMRMDVAKRTDRGDDDFRVTFRLLETF